LKAVDIYRSSVLDMLRESLIAEFAALSLRAMCRFGAILHFSCRRSNRLSRQRLDLGASRMRRQPAQAFTPKVGGPL